MTDLVFSVRDSVSDELAEQLLAGLISFNNSKVESSAEQALAVEVTDTNGKLIGGLQGISHRGWLNVKRLWVSEDARTSGIGRRLMTLAEQEAMKRGCFGIYLSTYSFQAIGFYKKLGFVQFGELADYPKGYSRVFLQKRI